MRYQGSVAYQAEGTATRRERNVSERAASFEVVSGGGLDAQARRGVSQQFVARVRAVVAVAAVLLVLGAARVAISSATVAMLTANEGLKTEISETETANGELKIARSVLSSNSRITRIATQNLGMVTPTSYEVLTVAPSADDADDAAQADAQPDGDAVPTDDAAATAEPLS